ncbi:MAG: aminodeoxychorismate/anthranilate synthase component II [Crocinitomicaceae bacterium]|nr:aminodeoxychorismate/anthranilate synthase component II [Crocinitomicaceae bacterium]MDG2463988.1 aminodeoxychorismate/anthranilate synthase component II [Crocinitomicaceae bacterium]
MKILLIDNFDSFTFNLSHYLEGMGAEVAVIRENECLNNEADAFDKVIISPGSGLPKQRLGMMAVLQENLNKKPILGVCLGMQALVEITGGKIYNQEIVKHGLQETIIREGDSKLLKGISNNFEVGLYHSWAVDIEGVTEWKVTSKSQSRIIMSIESKERQLCGVQFHPESIMTLEGKKILKNFLAQ